MKILTSDDIWSIMESEGFEIHDNDSANSLDNISEEELYRRCNLFQEKKWIAVEDIIKYLKSKEKEAELLYGSEHTDGYLDCLTGIIAYIEDKTKEEKA